MNAPVSPTATKPSALSRFVSEGPSVLVFNVGIVVLALATLALGWMTRQDVEPAKVGWLVAGPVLGSFTFSRRFAQSVKFAQKTVFLCAWTVSTIASASILFALESAGERPRTETVVAGLAGLQAAGKSTEEVADLAVHAIAHETADDATRRLLATMASIVRRHHAADAVVAERWRELDLAGLLSPATLADDAARQRGHEAVAIWLAGLGYIMQADREMWDSTITLVNSLPPGMRVGTQDALDIVRHARDASQYRWLIAEKEAADITAQLLTAVDEAQGKVVLRDGMLDLTPELSRAFQRAEARLNSLAEAEAAEREMTGRMAREQAVQMARLPERWARRDVGANGIVALAHAVNASTLDGPLPTPVLVAAQSTAPLHAVLPTLRVAQWHHGKDAQGLLARLAAFDRSGAMALAALSDPARRGATRDAVTAAKNDLKGLSAERFHYFDSVRAIAASLPADIRKAPSQRIDDAAAEDAAMTSYQAANNAWLDDMTATLDFADIHTDAMQLHGSLPDSLRAPYQALQARLAADARSVRAANDALVASDRAAVAQVDQAFAGSGLAYRH